VLLLTLSACGYQMAGIGTAEKPAIYYIENIRNNSKDLTITPLLEQEVLRFFSDHGALADSMDDAEYILNVTLENMDVSYASESATLQATSSNLSLRYNFSVENKDRKILMQRNFNLSESFGTGNTITTYNRNLETLFRELNQDIFSEFIYAFEVTRRR
jgi:outer membrane lipopolysaccharide assembly protein LptE/RlpB